MKSRKESRERRKRHIRQTVNGTSDRPRVFVFKSNRKIYVGAADDDNNVVIKSFVGERKINEAEKLGEKLGKELNKKKIKTAVFDRSGYKFHGVVKAVAEGLTKTGISI
ncbi:50S ribosomal protein L18 [Candidatus Dojkabacteria bacterium]|nr:50S ribosomal protein L18 [Candidatus Dojkabacteria bacterium]